MRIAWLALGLAAVSFAVLPAAAADAATPPPPVRLGLIAVGQSGSFYDLTVRPGSSVDVRVELVNSGTVAIDARSYVADSYTVVNGGFGARTSADPKTGTTTWVDYPTTTPQLAAGETITVPFVVTVPPDTPAGEYITSIVIENAVPVSSSASGPFRQTIRTAVAVSIRVPGPLRPGLSFAGHRLSTTEHGSIVNVDISNTGNERLTPTGWLTLRNPQGAVWRQAVSMDSFYAHTMTSVQVKLPATLPPGSYRVELRLRDQSTGATATISAATLSLARPGTAAAVITIAPSAPLNPLLAVVAITTILTAASAGIAFIIRVRRHRAHDHRAYPHTRRDHLLHASVLVALLVVVASSVTSAAWAVWTFSSVSGGAGAARATSVGSGATPAVTASGSSMTVQWTASTLGTGAAVTGYIVARYSTSLQPQTVLGNCAGVISNLGCIENDVPEGTWTYTVTPVFATNWRGAESARSVGQVSDGTPPGNNIWMWVTP